MNSKSTWNWIFLALALFAFIFFYQRHVHKTAPQPIHVLPQLDPADVTGIQINPAGRPEIRADFTNGVWRLAKPVEYPAQKTAVDNLLTVLQQLTPATYITVRELREHPKFDKEYGFDEPQFSLILEQGEQRTQILVGMRTAPGDQVFMQIVGVEGVFVVDAGLLGYLPRKADDWRDTALVDLKTTDFDRITLNSGELTITFQQNISNKTWTLTHPLQARADNARLQERLQMLQVLRVIRFVTDNPKADLETFGLQPPELELSLAKGTNTVAVLQFGKAATNEPPQIFARRAGVDSVVAVAAQLVAPWRARLDEFRDHRFVTFEQELGGIGITGGNSFDIVRSSNTWEVAGEDYPVDIPLMNDFVTLLGAMQITQFKDAVTEPDLPLYGLATPARTITLRPAAANRGSSTNGSLQLVFGTPQDTNVFVRRSDEDSVYAVKLEDYEQLPSAAWQLRERQLWDFSENDVVRLTVKHDGKTRELVRNGTNSWAFAPGSQGIINEFAVEEAVHRFGALAATRWVARGDEFRQQYGLGTNTLTLAFDLKSGEKAVVELGGTSPTQSHYAATVLDGQTWIYEFPFGLYQLVNSYLAIPPGTP